MGKNKQQSLRKRKNQLAITNRQLEILNSGIFADGELPSFAKKISQTNQFPLRPKKLEILQLNLGYMCNQVCEHCHVDAGPDRKEIMSMETMQQCLEVIKKTGAHTLDLTGGAPEMNPNFRWFLERKNFFSKDECQEIMDLVDKEADLRSGYHRGTENRDTLGNDDKNSCILNIKTNSNPEILNKFWNAIQLADLTTYHYNCKGIYNNRVQCHRYDVGQYYNPHADFHWLDEYSTNKLTLIVFLNDDYEGGEF